MHNHIRWKSVIGYMTLTFEVIKGHFRSNKFLCQVPVNWNQGGGGTETYAPPANTTTTKTATTNTTTTIKTTTTTITTTITTTAWSYCTEVNIGCRKFELCKWTCIAVFNRHFRPIYDQKDFFGTPKGEFTGISLLNLTLMTLKNIYPIFRSVFILLWLKTVNPDMKNIYPFLKSIL